MIVVKREEVAKRPNIRFSIKIAKLSTFNEKTSKVVSINKRV